MGIAVLLAAVVFAVYAGVLRTLDSQSRWRAAAYPSAAALDVLSLDLAGAVMPWGITNAPFVLAPSPDGTDGIKLHFFSTAPISGVPQSRTQALDGALFQPDVLAYAIREMNYVLSASNAAGTNGLIRVWQDFRLGSATGVVSNCDTWESVHAIRLEVYDGKVWTNTWGGGTNALLPQAARVMLIVGDESASRSVSRRTSEVLIPAGQRIAPPKSRK